MSTREEIKKDIKEQAFETSSQAPTNIISNREELKQELKTMSSNATSPSPQPTINQTLPFNPNKLDTPYYGGELDLEYCQIGNFTSEQLIKPQTQEQLLNKAQKFKKNIIKRKAFAPGICGDYQAKTGNIRISSNLENNISVNGVYWHETNHKYQHEVCGLSSPQTTAINYTKANTLIEKTSSIAKNLNIARAISELNKHGVSKVYEEDTWGEGSYKDITNLLSLLPQDIANILLDKNGNIIDFSPSNPNYKDLQDKIIKITCQDWDKKSKEAYEKQELSAQYYIIHPGMFNELSFSEKIKAIQNEDRHYNEVASKILKNVHIGYEETVDLTQYRDIIDTSTITAKDTKFREAELPSRETLLAINDYLISKGITSDKDKDAYMDKAFRDIVSKSPEADIELAKIMLTDKQVTNKIPLEIHHTDGDTTQYDGVAFVSIEQNNDYLYKPQPELNASRSQTNTTPQQTTTDNSVHILNKLYGGRY